MIENFDIGKKKGRFGKSVFCNLYQCCKRINHDDLKSGTHHRTIDVMNSELGFELDNDTLVTHASDWGIKEMKHPIMPNSIYSYTIEDATHGGVHLNLEIDSVLERVSRWYMTNQLSFLHDKIYPVPRGCYSPDWLFTDPQEARSIPKENACYANFTITSPYRIRVAEWCWGQQFIDCNFPKRYDTQDVELNMPILKGEKLEMNDYIKTLASYRFAICPTGNGLDTFRTWDCIMCNTVPVVMDNWMNRVFSKIWPMVIVSRYEFENVFNLITEFHDDHGDIEYDHSLLLEENFEELLDRIQYESDRIRR